MRKIIHIDMDCFYAAVEVKYRPELRGKPLGVGGPPNSRAVLCTASYEARKFGVRAAMPSSQAMRLCPDLLLVRPNFPLYRKESQAVREILRDYTEKIQPLSLDEAYLDVTDSPHCEGSATRIAMIIRERIFKELALTASAGVAPNKFLAKIASDWRKPNGQFVIRPQDVDAFMPNLKVEKIWGVGKVTAEKLYALGLRTCGDIQKKSVFELAKHFGSRAQDLHNLSHGIDERPVESRNERKSLTVEETFNTDLPDFEEWRKKLPELYEDWMDRMNKLKEPSKIRSLVVKVRFHDFQSMTREKSFRETPTLAEFEDLLTRVWRDRPEPIRLLGLGARLEERERDDHQLRLWE